jgi:hypothetical protein
MPLTCYRKAIPLAFGTALAAMAIAATAVTTAAPGRAACDDGTVGAERCLADCPDDQLRDADSGQCAAKANENAEAPLKEAWETAFGPLPSPSDFALAHVDNPSIALPGVGLPGIGVNALSIAPAIGAGAATGAALPSIAAPQIGLPAAPSLPEVGLPALPGPPPMPCVGFGTPIPFVGFSTC